MPRITARKCACGCGARTSGPKVRFVQGHNARTPQGRAHMKRVQLPCTATGPDHPCWVGTPEERFPKFVGPPDEHGCRPWLGWIGAEGYGVFSSGEGRTIYAHRLAYLLAVGPLAEDEVVHHVCQRRDCCEPSHLRALSNSEHSRLHWRLRRAA